MRTDVSQGKENDIYHQRRVHEDIRTLSYAGTLANRRTTILSTTSSGPITNNECAWSAPTKWGSWTSRAVCRTSPSGFQKTRGLSRKPRCRCRRVLSARQVKRLVTWCGTTNLTPLSRCVLTLKCMCPYALKRLSLHLYAYVLTPCMDVSLHCEACVLTALCMYVSLYWVHIAVCFPGRCQKRQVHTTEKNKVVQEKKVPHNPKREGDRSEDSRA